MESSGRRMTGISRSNGCGRKAVVWVGRWNRREADFHKEKRAVGDRSGRPRASDPIFGAAERAWKPLDRGRGSFFPCGDEGNSAVMDRVRVDKWMWAVRLFKTRGLAAKACESGRVRTGERIFKASSEVKGGELLELPFPEGPGTRVVRVLGLIDKRVGAPEARAACEEITPAEVIEARKVWSENRAQRLIGEQGRPTKKNRRAMDEKRGFFE
jgi:ribosome-associated heat shock protein Hsp15